MSYNYQDPKFKNLTKWKIGEEEWQVTGVWSVADDDNGRNARTEALGIRKLEKGQYVTQVIKVSKQDFEQSINNRKRSF